MAAARDRHVRLILCAWDRPLKDRFAALGYGVGVAERGEERLSPLAQFLPRLAIRGCRRILGRSRDQRRHPARSGFVAVVGVGRVVGRYHLGAEPRYAPVLDDRSNRKLGSLLREFL